MINESISLLGGYYRDVQGHLRSRKIKSLTSSAERNRPCGRFHRWHSYSAIREVNLIGTNVTPTPLFPCARDVLSAVLLLFLLCYICVFRCDINALSFPAMNIVVHINESIFSSQFTVSDSSERKLFGPVIPGAIAWYFGALNILLTWEARKCFGFRHGSASYIPTHASAFAPELQPACYLINASELSCVILKVIYYSGDCRPTVVLIQLRWLPDRPGRNSPNSQASVNYNAWIKWLSSSLEIVT